MGNHIALETWIKIICHKNYFDCGRNLLQYGEWIIAYFGVTTQNIKGTMVLAACYGILCYVIGWLAYHSDFVRANVEFGNRYNPLASELRAHMNKIKNRKD